jgi:hypothetical protein
MFGLEEVATVVTDAGAESEVVTALRRRGVSVVVSPDAA